MAGKLRVELPPDAARTFTLVGHVAERTAYDARVHAQVTGPWLVFERYALPLGPGANALWVRFDSRSLPSVALRAAEAHPSWSGTATSNPCTVRLVPTPAH